MLQVILQLHDDGTVLLSNVESDRLVSWCQRNKVGIVLAVGPCDDPNFQSVHRMERSHVMESKQLLQTRVAEQREECALIAERAVASGVPIEDVPAFIRSDELAAALVAPAVQPTDDQAKPEPVVKENT